MLKKKEKKKEEIFSFEEKVHNEGNRTLQDYEKQYLIKHNDNIINIIVNTRTSSCGSIQLSFMSSIRNSVSDITKQNRLNFFNHILNSYNNYNHIFFIDKKDGLLEQFFGDLGFKQVWGYLNYNTENYVNIWCFNKWSDEEVHDMLNIDEDDDDSW